MIDFAVSAGAAFSARAGRMERTREIVELLCADEFRGLPRTITWPATMVQLAHAVAALGDRAWAAQLEALTAPIESWHGIVPGPVLYRGSVAGARARLLETLGRKDEAAAAYRRAISSERALGAKPWWSENERRLGLLVAAG